MELTFDKTQKTQGTIKISVIRDDFQPGVDQKIKEYSKTASIKGFRPGKVPVGMIKKMYGTSLIVEEINKLVSEKLNSYLREADMQFLGEPMPADTEATFDWENDQQFNFSYEIGFAEPFDLKVDKKIKMDQYSIAIDDSVIDETIDNLRRQFGEIENPTVAGDEDTLYGTLTSKDEFISQEVSIDLREVEKAALKKASGAKVGDEIVIDPKKTFKNPNALRNQLKMTEEDFKQLKGKLSFTIQGINHYKLPAVDQDLFDKTFGKDTIKNEDGFRNRVKEIVSQNYKGEEKQFFEYKVKEKLVDLAKITLPEEFLKNWLVRTNEKMTEELVSAEFESYARELKWSLIRNKIVKDEDLKVEHEDVVAEAKEQIKKQFAGSGIGNQMDDQLDNFANNYLQGENGENYMKVHNEVQGNKAMAFITEQITTKAKEISLDEFRKL